ncbi:hypothetical protein SS1G_12505 [Sclerotinia sclerotiorum 1980 UF-70]|uniref:F-box domain-containing protein n=1 Tax=Sclerotinia sclerotiorum (strain ATCC 18683 / 1980 / Ss-1) TaxID=665079 RepID=A7F4I0_SCLS1|nr:hypothetical protein SS1G_12505 [Sclerotinia sclerotiorum 1980 UF-70]EDN97651.1 hypothetical protein SS1G_12505 [Sclerotinia sclerotiorum 1980 UF-70]
MDKNSSKRRKLHQSTLNTFLPMQISKGEGKEVQTMASFGRHIKHFAMSFEVDIVKLTNPPVKHDHDTITTFWGSYKWPFQNYNRYALLEGLEQKADETRTMTKAFQFIVSAEELGLSIDGGLGWLAGPDINQKVVQRGEKPVVFGSSRFEPEPEPKQKTSARLARNYQSSRTELPTGTRTIIQRMLQEVGYRRNQSDQSRDSAQSDQGRADAGAQEGPGRVAPPIIYRDFEENIAHDDEDNARFNDEGGISSEAEEDGRQGENVRSTLPNINDEMLSTVHNDIGEDNGDMGDSTREIRKKPSPNPNPLKPNELTSAQKEMLLELAWAQQAFMQTFTIAVIDSPITFANVKKLTIARLPNTHLPNLVREDFWNSLPNLSLLSLGIIPDWRELIKLPTSWVQDNRLPPSRAVTGVFQLLFKQISKRQNIESLHFEWICGGEYAPGLFCRNQHVLAAPVVSESINMVSRVQEREILSLPFIKYLSLKNCWFSPHIFTRFIRELKQRSLQHLTLDSVSLTAFIRPGLHPMPHANNAMQPQNALAQAVAANMGIHNHLVGHPAWAQPPALGLAGPPAIPMPVVITSPNTQPAWLNQPRNGSWAHVIDLLTPGERLADLRYARGFSEEPEPKTQNGLKELIFKSCGYVRLPLDFNQSAFNDGPRGATPFGITKRINDYESVMQGLK